MDFQFSGNNRNVMCKALTFETRYRKNPFEMPVFQSDECLHL